jgi:hypothetical protein
MRSPPTARTGYTSTARRPVVSCDPRAVSRLDDPEIERALLGLVEVWTSQSEGTAKVAVVEGGPADAAAALAGGPVRMARLTPGEALAWMAWAAASGGAHGVRRGAALGRFDAWWAATALTNMEWPPDPDGLGAAIAGLDWWAWDGGGPRTGWILRLAVADPDNGWAVALDAHDAATTEPETPADAGQTRISST